MQTRYFIISGSAAIAILFASTDRAAAIEVPVIDVQLLAEETAANIADAAATAMDYAEQVAQGINVLGTYLNAVENTIAIPMNAWARVEGFYYRTVGVANGVSAIASGDGTIMQRARMLKGIGRNASGMPKDVEAQTKWVRSQIERQWDENEKLLGLEDEREAAISGMMANANGQSANAIGRMQALQALNLQAQTQAELLKALNDQMARDYALRLHREAEIAAINGLHEQALTNDIEAMRLASASPATMKQSAVTWGR